MHRELETELLAVCKRVIQTAGFIGGPEVEGLEKEFAQFCETQYCVGVNSGTDALRFALMAARSAAGRHRPDCSEHVHRDDGGDFTGGSAP